MPKSAVYSIRVIWLYYEVIMPFHVYLLNSSSDLDPFFVPWPRGKLPWQFEANWSRSVIVSAVSEEQLTRPRTIFGTLSWFVGNYPENWSTIVWAGSESHWISRLGVMDDPIIIIFSFKHSLWPNILKRLAQSFKSF